MMEENNTTMTNFIQDIIDEDMKSGRYDKKVHTRFPPEPNGYLHIGHAKSICLNFGIAQANSGLCNLRFDDTNPSKEKLEYVNSIIEDVRWLGFDWDDRLYYASDYFEQLYEYAIVLIKKGLAYVCDLTIDEIREYRGDFNKPGKDSPYRDRSIDENLGLFKRMRAGEFPDGSRVLRAKIDMSSSNLNMRDPVLYRILRATHHRAEDKWCIYPMYDYAHPISDAIEGITHSICTLEFEVHRPLYDWILEKLEIPSPPKQIEFARLNLSYTVMSKRKLKALVDEGYVDGWNDPRMPTISGLRRRGYTPESIRQFCDAIGVAKTYSIVDISQLEHSVREHLNSDANRVMVVMKPLKVVIENYPEGKVEEVEVDNNPEKPETGKRKVPFSRVIYIEQNDFMEDPPKKFFRLAPGREIRLIGAYYIKCEDVIKDPNTGDVVELRCTYDPKSRGGWTSDGRKVRGTSHWVSAEHAVKAKIRLYDRLFNAENPDEDGDYMKNLNPDSLEILEGCMGEPAILDANAGDRFQFLRQGYFSLDPDSSQDELIFNRTVSLRDTWAKMKKKKNR